MSQYVGSVIEQPAQPQEDPKEGVSDGYRSLNEKVAHVIQELFRQIIKCERDKEEIRTKNKEEHQYLL